MAIGNISFGGLASGLPSDMVDQLMSVEQKRLTTLQNTRTAESKKTSALDQLGSKLSALASTATTLQSESSWSPHTATSSDTDKVAVSASYEAVAGTHSLEVIRLASSQTKMSAGGVTDSADTIAVGGITSFGFTYNGTAYDNTDFAIADGDTLADIASKINNHTYQDGEKGVSASVLYDGTNYRLALTAKDQGAVTRNSDGTTATERLTGVSFNMTWTGGAIWDTTAATGNTVAISAATPLTDATVTVNGLAGLNDPTDPTEFGFYYNGYDPDINGIEDPYTLSSFGFVAGDKPTLSEIADAITNQNISGLKASVVNDGYENRLVIDGATPISGLTSALVFGSSTLSTVEFGVFQTAKGEDAKLKVDGLSNIYSHTNSVTDVLPGVTMTLKETTSSAITVTVTDDTSTLKTTLNSFTTAFNDVIDYINTNKTGSLYGSTIARSIISQMRNELNTSTAKNDASGDLLSPFSILAELGLRTDQKTGKISFSSTELDTALSTNFTVLSDLFTNTQTEVGAANKAGLAYRLEDLLDNLTNSTSGALTGVKNSQEARLTSLDKSIEREEARLEKVRDRLTKKFSNLEQLVSSLNSQGSALTSALSKLG
ncbi:MAG: flagellar filament capping protein FliD [Magnetococcales bacterium]|nr:flagellar filament capping protein FliD [Magnetococcales bacterium]